MSGLTIKSLQGVIKENPFTLYLGTINKIIMINIEGRIQ